MIAYNNRGADKNELKDYTGAIENCTKAIELDSSYAMAYYNSGIPHSNLKEYEKAITDFEKAIALQPGYKEALWNRYIAKERKSKILPQ